MPRLKFKKVRWSLFWIPLIMVLSFSLVFAIKWGLKPKPIPQINPSSFANFEQIGVVIYRRLSPALRQEKMVVLGSAPWLRDYEKIWNGFIAAAREDHWKIDIIFEDPTLRPTQLFNGLDRGPLSWPTMTENNINSSLKNHLRFGHLVLVHTTYNYSSHRGASSLSKELEKELKRPWTAITMLSFAVNHDELEQIQPPCPDEVNLSPTDYAACSALRFSKKYLRKKLDPGKTWAALEQHGLKDYFLFVHQATSL